MLQSYGEERPTTIWLHLPWKSSHTSETWFCLQEGVWQHLGKGTSETSRTEMFILIWVFVCVWESAYMCVKSLQKKDLGYEYFAVIQLRTCFKCPRGTISWTHLSLPTIPDVCPWRTRNSTVLGWMCELHFQEGKAEKFDCFSLGLARVTPLAMLQTWSKKCITHFQKHTHYHEGKWGRIGKEGVGYNKAMPGEGQENSLKGRSNVLVLQHI